jgi:hypothetical protein
MRNVSARRSAIFLAVLVFCASFWPLTLHALPKPQPGCVFTCRRTVDTVSCRQAASPTFLAASSCEAVSECQVVADDPDGPGGNPPVLTIVCSYDCAMEYCLWV